ncbi:hypothetical protein MARA_62150 [Mycolicibacterium arabiense]|uniref:Uncharacterized protein n=1 Tax=Mycolicibacterium arabiense TaxID=1286181 RepID=A0A7I7S7B1_9MYCO|nr:hypothetical protein MARA_62150 [Mycolicibacterium arabiense]
MWIRRRLLLGRWVPGMNAALDGVQIDGISLPIARLADHDVPGVGWSYDRLDTVTGDRKLLLSSLFLNWVFGPALMFALAWLMLPDLPEYPYRADHRGPGPLYRHGHHLERPGLRRS